MAMTFDLTRLPTEKERLRFAARLRRLRNPELLARLELIEEQIPPPMGGGPLVLRDGFSYRANRVDPDASDRRAPNPEFRPPATRLMTSRGAALRFAITLVALAQGHRRPGQRARLSELQLPVVGDSRRLGWSDLIHTDAIDSRAGKVAIRSREKRARSVRNAVRALAVAGLVETPADTTALHEFTLLNEVGHDVVRGHEEYKVPKREPVFALPDGLMSAGWLHVLEDSEIALVLMIACGIGGRQEEQRLVMPSATRLLRYGIHRDAFSSARKTLEWFGLLDVEEYRRHEDGRAEDIDLRVHRLALLPDGFKMQALPTAIDALEQQLARA